MNIEKHDWVRFYQNGRLVIGQVEYIQTSISGTTWLLTDIGMEKRDDVLEVRKP